LLNSSAGIGEAIPCRFQLAAVGMRTVESQREPSVVLQSCDGWKNSEPADGAGSKFEQDQSVPLRTVMPNGRSRWRRGETPWKLNKNSDK